MARRTTGGRVEPRPGRVVATLGRRVLVRDDEGERVCFLSGRRAVIGDRVTWVPARGTGGKLVDVLPRTRALEREDFKGRTRVLASHLGGLAIVTSTQHPPYRPGLVDRYQVAASHAGLDVLVVLTKCDLGVPDEVEADVAFRESLGVPVVRTAPKHGKGMAALEAALAEQEAEGPWAFVGHSGVGKTSLVAALLPNQDVGPIGDISEFWDAGQHTTTGSRIFGLTGGAEVVDSPGIRTFLPSDLGPHDVRDHFPGLGYHDCRYRDCLHREGEDGCVAVEAVEPMVLARYRRMLLEVTDLRAREDW